MYISYGNKNDKVKQIQLYLNELSYYFDPVYISIKKNIHNMEVQKIREQNKKKKEIN